MTDLETQYDKRGRSYLAAAAEAGGGESASWRFVNEFLQTEPPSLQGKVLLDIGCGGGEDVGRYLALRADAYGIDSSEFMVAQAQSRVADADRIRLASAEDIPFPDQSLDIVASRMALHYLANLDTAYGEISRVLRPGGRLVFAVRHPFADLLLQQDRVYGQPEILSVPLFDGKVNMQIPSHTLADYFSSAFFRHFDLVGFEEFRTVQSEELGITVCRAMGISAIRK